MSAYRKRLLTGFAGSCGILLVGIVVILLLPGKSHAAPLPAASWGLRFVAQKEVSGGTGQQVMTLWAVATPTGSHACVTANYGVGGSSNRPIWLSCDWSTP